MKHILLSCDPNPGLDMHSSVLSVLYNLRQPCTKQHKVAISDTSRWKVNHGVEGSHFRANMHCYTHTYTTQPNTFNMELYPIIRKIHLSYKKSFALTLKIYLQKSKTNGNIFRDRICTIRILDLDVTFKFFADKS